MNAPDDPIGRGLELEVLTAGLERAREGSGGCMLLTGEPGIGKTRLAEASSVMAERLGFTVVWGRCWEAGGAPSYWPWMQVLRSLLPKDPRAVEAELGAYRLDWFARLLPELGDRPPALSPDAPFELLHVVTSWLSDRSAETPLWIGLDDLHGADTSSLALLRHLASLAPSVPLMVVGTARDTELPPGRAGELFQQVTRLAHIQPLARLARADVEAYLHRDGDLARASDDGFADALYDASEGNPLFLVELVRLLRSRGPEADPRQLVPYTVRSTISARLQRLSEATHAVLGHAAVVGREFDADGIERSFVLAEVPSALAEATDAGLLVPLGGRRWRFSHGLVPEVLLGEMAPTDRARLHATWARHLTVHGASCTEVAHHFLRGGSECHAEALEATLQAAARAHRRLAFDDEVALLQRARGLDRGDDPRQVLLLDRLEGCARLGTGDVEGGQALTRRAFDAAHALGDAEEMGESALAYGATLRFAQVDDALVSMLKRSLEALPPGDGATRARCLARLAAAQQPAPDPRMPIAMAERAIAMARRVDDPDVLLDVLRHGTSAMVDVGDVEVREPLDAELLSLAGSMQHHHDSLIARTRLIFDQFELGRTDAGWAHVEGAIAHAQTHAGPRHRWRVDALLAMRALFEARHDDARRHMADYGEGAVGNARMAWILQRAALARATDDRATLEELLPIIAGMFSHDETGRLFSDIFVAYTLLGLGRLDEVRSRVPTSRGLQALSLYDCSLPWMVAEIAGSIGDAELARAAREVLAPRPHGVHHLGVLSMTLLGTAEQAMQHAARALEEGARDATASGPSTSPAPPVRAHEPPTFTSEGDVWRLSYGGTVARVSSTRGLALLATLVGQPGQDVHVLDLVHPQGGRERVDTSDDGEVIDAAARDAYRRRATDLAEELEEARAFHDLGRIERLENEIEALTQELSRGLGLGGRVRRGKSAAERARVNVRKRIRDALDRIGRVHPSLGRHLERSVRTGTTCRYDPE